MASSNVSPYYDLQRPLRIGSQGEHAKPAQWPSEISTGTIQCRHRAVQISNHFIATKDDTLIGTACLKHLRQERRNSLNATDVATLVTIQRVWEPST